MSSIEWRREQPRVNPPRDWVLWWLDVYVIAHAVVAMGTYAALFVVDGWPLGLLVPLVGGFAMARFYRWG